MKHLITSINLIFAFSICHAQRVPVNTIVEHFTNTKCSICFNKNPGLYANLAKHPSVLYLSIHPSSPYTACILSKQNTADNDHRTKYYDVYGGTPVIVINGQEISGTSFTDTSLFKPFQGLTSAFSIEASTSKTSSNTIQTRLVIKKVDASEVQSAVLFTSIAEDTVSVNGGNGELTHYNVSRKSFQEIIDLPLDVNDSIVLVKTVNINPVWNAKRMFTTAILQEKVTNKLIQANQSKLIVDATTTSANDHMENTYFRVHPNPAHDFIYIGHNGYDSESNQEAVQFELLTPSGVSVLKGSYISETTIDIRNISTGLYYLILKNKNIHTSKKIFICR